MSAISHSKAQKRLAKFPGRFSVIDNRDGNRVGLPKRCLLLRAKARSRKAHQVQCIA